MTRTHQDAASLQSEDEARGLLRRISAAAAHAGAGDSEGAGGTNDDAAVERQERRRARWRHRRRFFSQLAFWGAVIAAAIVMKPLIWELTNAYFAKCAPNGNLTATCWQAYTTGDALGVKLPVLLFFLPPVLLSVIWAGHLIYSFLRHHEWEVATSEAQASANAELVTHGYTKLFNIYVRTKRRSYFLQSFALFGIAYSVLAILANISLGIALGSFGAFLAWWVPAINLAACYLLLVQAYHIASRFLPGDVIVRHMLSVLLRVGNVNTNLVQANEQAEKLTVPFRRDNPWWFYPG